MKKTAMRHKRGVSYWFKFATIFILGLTSHTRGDVGLYQIPRGDTNGVGEDEVITGRATGTSRKNKENRREEGRLHGHIPCRFRQKSRTG